MEVYFESNPEVIVPIEVLEKAQSIGEPRDVFK